jgi:hypothetical protein
MGNLTLILWEFGWGTKKKPASAKAECGLLGIFANSKDAYPQVRRSVQQHAQPDRYCGPRLMLPL